MMGAVVIAPGQRTGVRASKIYRPAQTPCKSYCPLGQ